MEKSRFLKGYPIPFRAQGGAQPKQAVRAFKVPVPSPPKIHGECYVIPAAEKAKGEADNGGDGIS
jgi:hypothetical protein